MALDSYEEVVSWSDSILQAVESRRMPPWHADPSYGQWANDRSLSANERDTLLGWLRADCPGGRTVARQPAGDGRGWRIRPDVVLQLPQDEEIPASGRVPYRFVKVATGFTEDVWVRAAEVKPDNRKVAHHILVFAPLHGDGPSIDNGVLASYLPGDEPMELPEGYAKRVRAGVPLIFQIHYTPTGKPERDRSSIGLVLAGGPPVREVRTLNVENLNFEIPAGAPNHRVETFRRLEWPAELLSCTPHMHLRGKDFVYRAAYPGGETETLLSVPAYDFNWQTTYRLAHPLELPARSVIQCEAHYDNSAANPVNPDPSLPVRRGELTEDEMMLGFVEYAIPYVAPPARPWWRFGSRALAAGGILACALAAVLLRRRLRAATR
jgi:hypothetical protein